LEKAGRTIPGYELASRYDRREGGGRGERKKNMSRQPEPDGREALSTSHRHSSKRRVGMRCTALLADCLSQLVGVRLPCDSGNAE
jgi:hypothetical protein